MKSITLATHFGPIHIDLSDHESRNDGRFNGSIRAVIDTAPDCQLEALESLILAHACAGVDVESAAYIEGINTALEAIDNHS